LTNITNIYIGLDPSLFLIVKGSQKDKKEVAVYVYNCAVLGFFSFAAVLVILFFLKGLILPEALINNHGWLIYAIALYGIFSVFIRILQTIFQIEKKAFHYAVLQSMHAVFGISMALVLIIAFSMGWQGKYLAEFFVTFMAAVVSYFYLKNTGYVRAKFDFEIIRELFFYLFPLSFHVIGIALIGSADRLFVSKMIGLNTAGVYNIALTMGLIIGLFHDSMLKAWSPFFYERLARNDYGTNVKIVKLTYAYYAFSFALLAVFIAVIPFIFRIMIDDKFAAALPIIPVIALAYTFESMRKLSVGYLYHTNKTVLIAAIALSGGILNLILNYFFIRAFGAAGAAWASVTALFCIFLFSIYFSARNYRMPWFFWRPAK
jgi:O-antigen/teichoic acid export membrane protein